MMAFATLLILVCLGYPKLAQAVGDTLAEVDGVPITSEEVEKPLASQLSKLEGKITT